MRIGEAAAILVGFLCCHWVWPSATPMHVERTPGHGVDLLAQLDAAAPRIVLAGSPADLAALDPAFLGAEDAFALPSPRLASAWWYLILKNALAKMDVPPQAFVVFYSGVDPTLPEKRTFAPVDRRELDALATDRERTLDRLAYRDRMDPVEFAFSERSGLYQSRRAVRERLDAGLETTVSRLAGVQPMELKDAREERFSPPHWEPALRQRHRIERTAARSAHDNRYFDFAAELPASFLPEMADLAARHGIRLVFVETPSPLRHTPEQEGLAAAYRAAFRYWLASRGGASLDMREVPRMSWTESIRAVLPSTPSQP